MSQLTLIDQPPDFRFKGAGHRRTHVGNAMEEVVCSLLGFTRGTTGSQKTYCADAFSPSDLPVEIKSVCINSKCKGKSVLYDFRLEKDRIHAPRLAYVFACHKSEGGGKAKTMGEFLDRLTQSMILVIVPAWIVRMDALRDCALQKVKTRATKGKRCGYERAGYVEGYRNLEIHRYIRDAEHIEPVQSSLWGREFNTHALYYKKDPWSLDPRDVAASM